MRTKGIFSITCLVILLYVTVSISIIPKTSLAQTTHDLIFIEGDMNFTSIASNEGWLGDGTSQNPYIIQDLEISSANGHCIEIRNSTVHFIIRESQISNGIGGVYLSNVSNGEIRECTLKENQLGILIENSQGIKVLNNVLSSNLDGIYLFNSKLCSVEGNNASGNLGEGITLFGTEENNIENNTLLNNQYALALLQSNNNKLSYNAAFDNVGGIQLQGTHRNQVNRNIISNNNIGLYLLNNCTYNEISYNEISRSLTSGIILIKTSNNTLHHNNIIDNTNQLTTTFSLDVWHDENSQGNFWSDYRGKDTDEDGIGDTILPHKNVDFYPLSETVVIQIEKTDNNESEDSIIMWILTIFTVIVTFIIFAYFGYRMGQRRQNKQ